MQLIDLLAAFRPADFAAIAILLISWIGIGWRIENPPNGKPSVSKLMGGFRREWMTQMITRQPRIFDAQMIGHLRQGAAFFASASMLAIGGGLALIGNTDQLRQVAMDLTGVQSPPQVWEIKLIVLLLFLSSAFLKYVWAHRLFGYTAVLMSAVPNDASHPECAPRAKQAGDLSVLAARAFTRGMRTTYFALAAAAWLLGPAALIAASLGTVAILWRREFTSASHATLSSNPPTQM